MKILGLEGMSGPQLQDELQRGARFVIYKYAISVIIITFRRSSDIHFIPAGKSSVAKGLGYTGLTFILGWWGIPWGPIFSIGAIATNFSGGKDVTAEVVHLLQQSAPPPIPNVRPV